MKPIDLSDHQTLSLSIVGISMIIILVTLALIIDFLGNALFPVWWHEPASSFTILIGLLSFLVSLQILIRNK